MDTKCGCSVRLSKMDAENRTTTMDAEQLLTDTEKEILEEDGCLQSLKNQYKNISRFAIKSNDTEALKEINKNFRTHIDEVLEIIKKEKEEAAERYPITHQTRFCELPKGCPHCGLKARWKAGGTVYSHVSGCNVNNDNLKCVHCGGEIYKHKHNETCQDCEVDYKAFITKHKDCNSFFSSLYDRLQKGTLTGRQIKTAKLGNCRDCKVY